MSYWILHIVLNMSNSMESKDEDNENQSESVESNGGLRDEYREHYLDDLQRFREKFEEMGLEVDSEVGEKNLFRWFTYWRKEVRRFASRLNDDSTRHVVRFPNPEEFFKFIHRMHEQESDESLSIDSKGFEPNDRHMDEASRKRRDSFRKEWR